MVGAVRPVLGQRHFLGVLSSIRSVPCSLVTSIFQEYYIQYSNLTLLALSVCCFSPYLPVLACGGHSHHCVLSCLNQNLHFGSICGVMTELDGRELLINTPQHFTWHQNGIGEKEEPLLKECRKRVRGCDTTRPWRSTQLCGSTISQKQQVGAKVRKDRVCIWVVGLNDMRWSALYLGSPQYILSATQYITVTNESLYAPIEQSISIFPVSPCTRHHSVLCEAEWQWWWEMGFPATLSI